MNICDIHIITVNKIDAMCISHILIVVISELNILKTIAM